MIFITIFTYYYNIEGFIMSRKHVTSVCFYRLKKNLKYSKCSMRIFII